MTPPPTRSAPRRANARKGGESSRAASNPSPESKQKTATAVLVLADGAVFWGHGAGAAGVSVGELCFNTSMTGYQEILTDPSYAGQVICFTFPHIGNTGANDEDMETRLPAARGLVLRAEITQAANFRATSGLDEWLKAQGLIAVTGVDTRRLTRRLREQGAVNGVVAHDPTGKFEREFDLDALRARAADAPSMEGLDLACEVTCAAPFEWDETRWALGHGHGTMTDPKFHVVAMDFGAKRNILRCLADLGCRVS
ncbi:MAG: carbamoyl phosphate synthase small subunit, partial [Alphaproteobacteria bacterium]|nr:carbamoyl phosphate synthase small subunit [Alphaproteobacteria bacterium]